MGTRHSQEERRARERSSAQSRKRKKKKSSAISLGFCDDVHTQPALFQRGNPFYYNTAYLPRNDMHLAACEGDIQTLQYLIDMGNFELNHKDEANRSALHFACFYGQTEIVVFLVKSHCEVNAQDNASHTPLMKVHRSHQHQHEAIQSWEDKIVRFLLQHGADLSMKDINCDSVLHHAIYAGKPAAAAELLAHGADIEERTKDGLTPLMLALREKRVKMAQFLIKMNADVHVSDHLQRNTLMYAVRCDSEGLVSLLLQRGLDMYAEDIFKYTAFHYASKGGYKVRTLLLEFDYNLTLNLRAIRSDGSEYWENPRLIR